MAIGLVFEAEGVTQQQYDSVKQAVSPDNRLPAGMLYHVAGPTSNGWRVVEVWESQALMDAFFQEKLGAELQKANINVQPQQFEVYNIMQP